MCKFYRGPKKHYLFNLIANEVAVNFKAFPVVEIHSHMKARFNEFYFILFNSS